MSALSIAAIVAIIGSPLAAIAWVRLTRTSQRIDQIIQQEAPRPAPRWPAGDEDDDMCALLDAVRDPRRDQL